MAGGTITSAMTGDYGLQIRWTSTPDVATNTSKFTAQVYVLYPSINITSRTGCYTTINGSKLEFKTGAIKNEYKGATLLTTRTVTIQHDEDGKKTIPVIAYFPIYLKSESLGWIYEKKASGMAVLDDIPRASAISTQTQFVTVDGNSKWSIVMARASEAFYHKATLSIGGYSYTTEAFATNGEYIIPTEWLKAIPNATKGTVSVSVQTYSDSTCTTAMGDPVTTTFEILTPATAGPVISDGWASIAPYNAGTAASALTVYVQGYSKAEVTFNASKVSAQYGAGIASVQIAYDGVTASAAPYRTKVLTKTGAQVVRCTVTDSRGYKAVKDLTITVESYAEPALKGISVYRCDSSGAEDESGAYIYFKATAVTASLAGQNTLSLKAAYRQAGSTAWTNETALTSGTGRVLGGSLSSTVSYEARITATDRLGNKAEFFTMIGTADVALNIMPGGKGAAFGKYAEHENALDIGDWKLIAANFYPVNSVYMTAGSENPASLYDGTWEQVTGTGLPFNVWKRTK